VDTSSTVVGIHLSSTYFGAPAIFPWENVACSSSLEPHHDYDESHTDLKSTGVILTAKIRTNQTTVSLILYYYIGLNI
jgi:hypothetical protein